MNEQSGVMNLVAKWEILIESRGFFQRIHPKERLLSVEVNHVISNRVMNVTVCILRRNALEILRVLSNNATLQSESHLVNLNVIDLDILQILQRVERVLHTSLQILSVVLVQQFSLTLTQLDEEKRSLIKGGILEIFLQPLSGLSGQFRVFVIGKENCVTVAQVFHRFIRIGREIGQNQLQEIRKAAAVLYIIDGSDLLFVQESHQILFLAPAEEDGAFIVMKQLVFTVALAHESVNEFEADTEAANLRGAFLV